MHRGGLEDLGNLVILITMAYAIVYQIVRHDLQGGRYAMLQGTHVSQGKCIHINVFIDNGLIYSKWGGREINFFSMGDLARNN